MTDLTARFVSRAEWGARPPLRRSKIALPTPRLWLHHSAGQGEDERSVRAIQDFHMGPHRKWSDIGYSFLIDDDPPDVDIFEGRGAGAEGGHTKHDNDGSHGICVMGNFMRIPPKSGTVEVLVRFIAYGHLRGWWPAHITGGHRDAPGANTACPGDALYALIPEINERVAARLENGEIMPPPDDIEADTVTAQEVTETGERPGLDRPFDATWPWARNRRVFSKHTKPDDAVSAEELSAYLHRYHHRVVLPEIESVVRQVGAGGADNVARNLARRSLTALEEIGEAASDA